MSISQSAAARKHAEVLSYLLREKFGLPSIRRAKKERNEEEEESAAVSMHAAILSYKLRVEFGLSSIRGKKKKINEGQQYQLSQLARRSASVS